MATPDFPLTEAQMQALRESLFSGVFFEVFGVPWRNLRARAAELVELQLDADRMADDGCPHDPRIGQPRLNRTDLRRELPGASFSW